MTRNKIYTNQSEQQLVVATIPPSAHITLLPDGRPFMSVKMI